MRFPKRCSVPTNTFTLLSDDEIERLINEHKKRPEVRFNNKIDGFISDLETSKELFCSWEHGSPIYTEHESEQSLFAIIFFSNYIFNTTYMLCSFFN